MICSRCGYETDSEVLTCPQCGEVQEEEPVAVMLKEFYARWGDVLKGCSTFSCARDYKADPHEACQP